jgi:hypothetical protein
MYNGTVFTFNSVAVAKAVGLSYSVGAEWVDVSEPADMNKLFELGQTNLSLKVKYKGHCALTFKSKGTASLVWGDGTTTTLPGTWMAGPYEDSGDFDGPVSGSIELRPTVPDSA